MASGRRARRGRTARAARTKKYSAGCTRKSGGARLPASRRTMLPSARGDRSSSDFAQTIARPAFRCRATGVRVETWPVWAQAGPAAGLPAMPPIRRGFPPDSETSCRCRPDRGENALAQASFRAKTRNRKAIYCQILAKVGWLAVVFFVSFQANCFIIPFRRGTPGWLITTIKIENLCH